MSVPIRNAIISASRGAACQETVYSSAGFSIAGGLLGSCVLCYILSAESGKFRALQTDLEEGERAMDIVDQFWYICAVVYSKFNPYNFVSKRHFSLNDVKRIPPDGYDLFRLRTEDGFLDRNLEDTWNCVAVHKDTTFYNAALELIR